MVFVINSVPFNLIFSNCFYLGVWLLPWWLSSPFDSPFSPAGHLYLLPPASLLYPTLWISLCVPGCGEHLGNWLLAGSGLSPFESLFSPPGHLCLLPPSSLLCVTTPWTSLRGPDCGEHTGNWLLASLLSPLLIPPLLHLVNSIIHPSPSLRLPLWTSPGVPHCGEDFHH